MLIKLYEMMTAAPLCSRAWDGSLDTDREGFLRLSS